MIHEFVLKKNAQVDEIKQDNNKDEDNNKSGQTTVIHNQAMDGKHSDSEDKEDNGTEE